MRLLDWLTGTKRPAIGTSKKPAAELKKALLALNRDTAPWHIRDGAAENCDLVAEWKIVDAKWYEIFAKAGLKEVFQILMRIDDAKDEVRVVDRKFTVEWKAGIPSLSYTAWVFRGRTSEIEFGQAYGFTEKGALGEIYNYRFRANEIKKPIQNAANANGWTWTYRDWSIGVAILAAPIATVIVAHGLFNLWMAHR
jgi:hypothetical protein